MFKRLVAILLVIAVSLSSFTRFVIFTSFKINQSYIASVLCVNKDRPELHCSGKCYLASKLKQAEEKEERGQENQKKFSADAIFTEKLIIHFSLGAEGTDYCVTLAEKPSQFYPSIFQPPKILSDTA